MEGVDENGLPEFLNPALLSNIAVFLKDTVRRGSNMKGAVEHPHSFTGRDVVVSSSRCLCRSKLLGLTFEYYSVGDSIGSPEDRAIICDRYSTNLTTITLVPRSRLRYSSFTRYFRTGLRFL
jgi:hypothetical protein